MSIFAAIPWKAVAAAVPLFTDIFLKAKGIQSEGEAQRKELLELKARMETLDSEIGSLYKGLRIVLIFLAATFLVAVTALVIAVLAYNNYGCN